MCLSIDDLLQMYEKMLLIRHFDERIIHLSYCTDLVPGRLHSCIGQEAVAVGACRALRNQDCIISTHRGQGHCIAKGADVYKMMAEFLGRATGYCSGRGGVMHILDLSRGVLGTTGIVGSGIPIAVGVALAIQYKQLDEIVLCFFGDGAANTGSFHEGLNLAAVWNVPVVFLCENNQYAQTTPFSKAFRITKISRREVAYGISGSTVDGNDVIAVYEAVADASQKARSGDGPSLIEARTYRIRGHYEGEPATYRSDEEIDQWRRRDPIERLKARLIQEHSCGEEIFHEIESSVLNQVEQAVKYAIESSFPSLDSISADIYAD